MLLLSPKAGGFLSCLLRHLHLSNAMCITLCCILELDGGCGVPLEDRFVVHPFGSLVPTKSPAHSRQATNVF